MRTRTAAAVALVAAVPAATVGATALTIAMSPTDTTGPLAVSDTPCKETGRVWHLDQAQSSNARAIVATARTVVGPLGAQAAHRAAVIGVATAWVESRLHADLTEAQSDRDSAGMLQQRRPWGPLSDRMNPTASARMFFTGGQGGQRGLLDIPGWQEMNMGAAAQSVQVSAFPSRYGEVMPQARAIVAGITGTPAKCDTATNQGIANCPPSGSPAENGLTPDALTVLRCGHRAFTWLVSWGGVGSRNNASDHPSGRAVDAMIPAWQTAAGNQRGWQVAAWYRRNARALGITYVIFDGRIWSVARNSEGWRVYTHVNDRSRTDPTLLHRDHVHVSVHGNAGRGSWGGNGS